MNFVLHSITYHNCPLRFRERVSLTKPQQRLVLKRLHAEEGVSEALLLETCNRFELYLYTKKGFNTEKLICSVLGEFDCEKAELFSRYQKKIISDNVTEHLFKVAAGLDSQVIGEDQIVNQLKSAYSMSIDCHTSGLIFHRLMHYAFRAGKAVRTETDINCGALSVGLAVVKFAQTRFDLPETKTLVLGAGQNSEIICSSLLKYGCRDISIANRNRDNSKKLTTKLKTGKTVPLSGIAEKVNEFDLIIASTSCPEHILTAESKIAFDRPVMIIDIAVPRDIAPETGELENVELYNLEDINRIISKNTDKRNREIPQAEEIVKKFQTGFQNWHRQLDIRPVIKKLNKKTLDIARSQAERYASDFNSENSEKLQVFAESLAKKLLYEPIDFIKNRASTGERQLESIDLINKMFSLEDEEDQQK
jgi:glutamyl-tRNA reductase